MGNVIRTAVTMGLAAIALSAQQLPPPAGAPPAAAEAPPAGAPAGPPQEEIEAMQKIQQTTDADTRINAVNDFTLKYPTSSFRGYAFTLAGEAAQTKRDSAKAKFYYENAIKADPNSDYAMIMLGMEIAQGVGEHDLDKKEKLDQAQGYADKAIDLIGKRTKQPGETDAQFEESKKDDLALAHRTIGMVKLQNQQNAEAGKEFMIAVDSAVHPDPLNLIRAGMAFNNAKQFDDANKALDRFLAIPELPEQYKKIAQDEKKKGEALKNQK